MSGSEELNEMFLDAVDAGDVAGATRLLKKGADVDACRAIEEDDDGYELTALHIAVRRRDAAMVSTLLKYKADTDISHPNDDTLLMVAVRCSSLEIVKMLVSLFKINERNALGHTALRVAVDTRDHEMLRVLIGAKARIDIADRNDLIPLAAAAERGDCETISLLLSAGAGVNHWTSTRGHRDVSFSTEPDWRGCTALHAAAERGQLKAVSLLIRKGAYIRATDDRGETPLHYAARGNHWNVAQKLIEDGALVWVRDRRGETPVSTAGANCATETLKLFLFGPKGELISYEPDSVWEASCRDARAVAAEALNEAVSRARISFGQVLHLNRDRQAFLTSLHERQIDTVSILLAAGIRPDQPDRNGVVPWITAIVSGCEEAVSLFRERSPESERRVVDLADFRGVTALMREAERGSLDGVDALLRHGADPNKRDGRGDRALDYLLKGYRADDLDPSARSDKGALIQRLLRAGADPDMANRRGSSPRIDAEKLGLQEFLS